MGCLSSASAPESATYSTGALIARRDVAIFVCHVACTRFWQFADTSEISVASLCVVSSVITKLLLLPGHSSARTPLNTHA